ncbi:hypothetical protein B0T14DRAFT_564077 [Immersiella caudata]|uniref:Uncharacterized protein n=1 Tax=Immersiella caudata TaxID=314043 RepID=A0AA40C275_9PEZI|nr:hypothetical protein B0T14DRAFT_564077 [Immersiella caudata]
MIFSIPKLAALCAIFAFTPALAAPTNADTDAAAAPDAWCCFPNCTECINLKCSDAPLNCIKTLPFTSCCALELNTKTGKYTNSQGQEVTFDS